MRARREFAQESGALGRAGLKSHAHGDIGRHDTALDGDDETLLSVFQRIANRGDVIGVKSIFAAISAYVYSNGVCVVKRRVDTVAA